VAPGRAVTRRIGVEVTDADGAHGSQRNVAEALATSSEEEAMHPGRSRKRLVVAVGVSVLVAVASILPAAGQAVPPRGPQPSPKPESCRSTLGGTVSRRVGNLQKGPSHLAGLRNIQVQLLDANGGRVAETRTDRDGHYAFGKLCPGAYTVCPGTPCPTRAPLTSRYDPASREVSVPRRLQAAIDFVQTEPPPVRQP
jgi:SdrD B-like domain